MTADPKSNITIGIQHMGASMIPKMVQIRNLLHLIFLLVVRLINARTNGDTMTPKGPPTSPPKAASSFPRFV